MGLRFRVGYRADDTFDKGWAARDKLLDFARWMALANRMFLVFPLEHPHLVVDKDPERSPKLVVPLS